MRLSKLFFHITIVFLLCIQSTFASQNYAQQLQRISTDEGLSHGYVVNIQEDDIGFIWVATQQGLNRFDGYQVTTFDGGFGLDKHYIYALLKTNDGKLIVSTDIAGAYIIDPITLKTEKIYSGQIDKEKQLYSPISAIAEQHGLYYLAIDEQVFRYDKASKLFVSILSLPSKDDYIRALKIDKNTLYVGANSGLFTANLATNQLVELPFHSPEKTTADNKNVKFLNVDDELGLLVGTVEGMYQIAFNDNKEIDSSNITTIIPDYNIWEYINSIYGEFVATEKGLYSYHRETGEFEFILSFDKSKFDVSENSINDIMIDKSGTLWLTSRTQGVFTWPIKSRRFKHILLPGNNTIHKIYQDKDNIIWLATDDGIARYDPLTKQTDIFLNTTDPKAAFGNAAIYDIFPSSIGDDYLWLSTFNGFQFFDKRSGEIIENTGANKGLLIRYDIFGFAQIKSNEYAFLTDKNYYVLDEKTGKSRVIKGLKELLDPINAYSFHTPLESHPNEFVIGTNKNLYRYNEKTQKLTRIFQTLNPKNGLFTTIENYYLDSKRNILWLASTYEGLFGVDPITYEIKHHIGSKNAVNTDEIYSLLPDEYGFLWISTKNGLYQLNLDTLSLASYSTKDGLVTNQFSAIAAIPLNDGRLMFGTNNTGAIVFDPSDFLKQEQLSHQKLAITDINLFTRELNYIPNKYLNMPLELDYEDMGLTVNFSTFAYPNVEKTYYKVVLDGPTSLSYEDLRSNHVFFTKLQPGNYSLTISAHTKEGLRTSDLISIRINVAYAPWKSPFAIAAYVILIIAVLFFIFWQYRSRQVAIEQAHRATIHSQKQTELALKNNKSGVWDYNFKDASVSTLRGSELGYTGLPVRVHIEQFLALIHKDDRRRFENQWENYFKYKKQQNWQATYRLQHKEGHWLWYQDTGQVIYDPQTNEPLYVSGIYTNITEQRANEQQAKILGEAFSQINDWLLILDKHLMPFSANNSFIETFSNEQAATKISPKLFIRAIGKDKCREFANILKKLKATENWQSDAYIKTAKSNEHPIHISATAVTKDTASYYVVVITDLTEQKRAENELRYLANFDPLTHLPNRSLMYQNIEKAIKHANESNTQCALLFIDLDKFKPVNDSFGHAVGDKLLCNITQRVNGMLGANAKLGRQSGDEFLVLIQNIKSLQSLRDTVRKISNELANKVIIEDFSINISASIGVALYPFDAVTTDILIRNADVAMMHAKQGGRNDFKFFSDEMNELIKQKLLLENDLKDAVKDNRFFNHYQPIIDIEEKTINGVELLMRWKNEGQLVSPALFIPVAEETGLIELLTEQALQRALIEIAPILSANPLFYISLNLSPKHILKTNITQRLMSILADSQVHPRQLRLEITESILLEDKLKAAKQLQNLKAAGFKLLLDDFGTGYSSLTYLSQFPINVIKIDQSFVNSIGIDKGDESIIKTILSLAENLDLYCIAEGVETREQMIFLAEVGCTVLQGYYFARPMDAKDLRKSDCFSNIFDLI
ncbi:MULTISPECIES: EAL domain-containing protein [unclassified Pseudoalteromonas]|uniref:EAL domain-containing protein n=1 Tax=unclassified Pseudoalteromonas TaxID=194690 RepID=UPI00040890AB|nr:MULTISPECIES: EAL domain-containing protein [unclassified Pseudoalteromonas]MBH0059643.1 EAL domain-containing protein [Pseudoalteromonas sp. NZS71]